MNCRSIVPGYYGRHSKDRVLRCSGRIIVLSPDRQWDSDPNRPRMYVCTMHRKEAADAGLDIQRSIMKVKARKLTMLILSWRHWNIVSYQESERKESEKAQTLKARGQLDKSHNLQVRRCHLIAIANKTHHGCMNVVVLQIFRASLTFPDSLTVVCRFGGNISVNNEERIKKRTGDQSIKVMQMR